MIKSLSTYYLPSSWVSPLTGETCTEYILSIYIWNGDISSPPLEPEYTITKTNLFSETGTDYVNIARLVNDYIDYFPETLSATGVISSDNQVWVKTSTEYVTDDPLDDGVAQNELTQLAVKGYDYGNDIQYTDFSNIFLNGTIFRVSRNTKFTVPILIDTTKVGTIKSYPNNTLSYDFNISPSTDSSTIVKLLVVDVEDAESDDYIEVKVGTDTITLIIKDEYKYDPVDIVFLNKYGSQQTLTFFKQQTKTINIERSSYESVYRHPSEGYHRFIDFTVNGKTTFTITSGFVPEQMNESFKQLLLSTQVYMLNGTDYIPLNVTQSSMQYKTRLNDRLISYDIEFGYSFYDIEKV